MGVGVGCYGARSVEVAAPAWSPSDLGSALKYWWRTDTGITVSTGVSSWVGKVASTNLAEAVGANQPALSSGYLNGHDGVVGDGSDDHLSVSGLTNIAQPLTIAIVVKLETGFGNSQYIFDSVGRTILSTETAGNGWGVYAGTWLHTGVARDTTADYWVIKFDGASTTVRKGGTQVASGNAGANGTSTGLTFLTRNTEAGNFAKAGVPEWMVISGALSAGDQTSLESYFATRYAL